VNCNKDDKFIEEPIFSNVSYSLQKSQALNEASVIREEGDEEVDEDEVRRKKVGLKATQKRRKKYKPDATWPEFKKPVSAVEVMHLRF